MRSKILILVLALISTISLAINVFLLVELSGIRAQAEKRKKAHDRLARRDLQMEEEQDKGAIPVTIHPESIPQPDPVVQSLGGASPTPGGKAEDDGMFWGEVQGKLASVIDEEFPELRLSKRELVELIGTVRTIRDSMQTTRELARTSANAEAIKRFQAQLDHALQVFEEITGMDAGEFLRHVRTNSGIDDEELDDGEIVTEYLRDFRP